MKKLTKKEAKEWAIKKWQNIVGNDGRTYELYSKYPELNSMKNGCSYCELYFNRICDGCPIKPKIEEYDDINESGCVQEIHPFYQWDIERTKENAQKVLDLIIEK